MGAEEDLAAAKKQLEDAQAEAEKWKGLSRKHEDRAKENATAADELKKLKESSLSEQQKLDAAQKAVDDKLAALEKRAEEADARELRAEVAAAKKLTPAQAKRLSGATREELEADADDLLETFKPADTGDDDETDGDKPRPTNRPEPALRGGGDPTQDTGKVDIRKVVADTPRF